MTTLNRDNAVLMVIDVQGKLARLMQERESLYKNLSRCIRGAQTLGLPILCIEQNPDGLGTTIAEISSQFDSFEPLKKMSFSCIGNSGIKQRLLALKRTHILVTGIETHVCVYQSVRDMLGLGFKVDVVTDAVSSRSADNKHYALQKMRDLGASLTTTEMCLFELVATSEDVDFRQILKLVK